MAVDVVPLDLEQGEVQSGRCCMRLLLCCTVLHSTTRTWASCQGVIVLLSALPLACGKSEDLYCVIQRLDKQTSTLLDMLSLCLVHSPSHSAAHLIQPGHPPRRRNYEACLNLRSRLAATAAEQVPLIDDSPIDYPGCFTTKLKRSYPGPWLAIAASPTAGVSMSCTGYVANALYFLIICIVL